ncbi:centrosomal protein of 131 kDa [Adelges cooleyi]|uniref:centrosomal protein of 131 kDa n=1 Tax=Adelges cooleyi TaxID=133065 RepID=UPI00217F43CD|nr:centrosomal protein of 131 kDa [Adelges cooleyi]XP_050420917.1 centrosomal protein of 131 kDa [Adelges cooleyi]
MSKKPNNKNATSPGSLSLRGSQINLSSRLTNFNISSPLRCFYNENVDLSTLNRQSSRPMSASTLGPVNQESPRKPKLVKRPQSADTLNTSNNNRHNAFNFNNQQNETGARNRIEDTFDELNVAELSEDSCSTSVKDNKQQKPNDDRLEPGLTSKPPIPPTTTTGNSPQEYYGREVKNSSVTFDDAIELKFQRWFPNSVPVSQVTTAIEPDLVSLNGMSYEYSERVIDKDKGTITYTRSSSSMSIRGSQDQLDEEHLYSNLSAAISSDDKLKATVSVDLLEVLQNDDNRRGTTIKKKKKKITPTAVKTIKDLARSADVKKRDGVKCKASDGQNDAVKVSKPVVVTEKKREHLRADVSPVDDHSKVEVVSWMSSHPNQRPATPKYSHMFMDDRKTSTYEEIVSILKELESENDDIDMNVRKSGVSDINKQQTLVPETSSSKALWSFLDEVEKNSNCSTPSKTLKRCKSPEAVTSTPPSPEKKLTGCKKGTLQQFMELGKAELAQKVASLHLKLTEKEDVIEKLKITMTELQAEHARSKADYESTVTRHQKFIDKLINEKKELSANCAATVKELTKKMNDSLASQEERHKIELKKAVDKQMASEKVNKDRWVDLKTKKIKELTIKGIEPELNRMSVAYQEELSELRRIHQAQTEEIEATWHRRMATMRDKMDAEREQAIVAERETSRNRLELEIAELEKSYQEQRKRLLGEIHAERLRQEREGETALMEKRRVLEQKFEKSVTELQEKISSKERDFQKELKTIKETCEIEKTAWLKNQTVVLEEKENAIKEMYKKERDRHIELVIQKLENESTEREKASETKIKRIKSEYEADILELENTISGHRMKLNELRTKVQEGDDKIADMTAELSKNQAEIKRLQESISKLKEDLSTKDEIIKTETVSKVESLQAELTKAKSHFESKIKAVENEKEREINHVYIRVREAIARKDESIQALQSERDAALNQCSSIERLLEKQRREFMKLK